MDRRAYLISVFDDTLERINGDFELHKALMTPFSICPYFIPPERHIPSARAKYGKTFVLRCKGTKKY
jgi:hypothetical protein